MNSSLMDASTEDAPALWELSELPAVPAPVDRPVTRSAWPHYRALHLIGAGHLVLRVNVWTGRADLADPQCDLADTRKRADQLKDFFHLPEERAARQFAANKKYVVLAPAKKHRFGRVWLKGNQLKLTPAGEELLARWSRLQDPARSFDDRLDATLAAYQAPQRRRP
ncbi:Hypothetical protein AJAP_42945 (plasmid) [Amycolatopsis japonica]|uniref:Uncharacterized protein n=1 Tax=Amycolatopsis japonica TaxID=208439 RepID=A0A075VEM9_9PSEU|nr:hypothetical protein [Amycolatopsis japonica]AIG81355.1 Hypothetical protein AJAP_42945 [Amycolatopsis japonica]